MPAKAFNDSTPGRWPGMPGQPSVAPGKNQFDHPTTILLVEDDPDAREVVQSVLRGAGYEVLTADSEETALQVWERYKKNIDLLLTDMLIPSRTTGLDLAKKLQGIKPGLRIVYASGFSREIGSGETAFLSQSAYLQKPFTPDALLQTVAQSLAH